MVKSTNLFANTEVKSYLMISTRHLTPDVMKQIDMWFGLQCLPCHQVLFDIFTLSNDCGWGIRLFSTPWDRTNLAFTQGINIKQLRKRHADNDVPELLTNILIQASRVNISILIFDINEPVMPGLKVFF